jgi:hypothetical protein
MESKSMSQRKGETREEFNARARAKYATPEGRASKKKYYTKPEIRASLANRRRAARKTPEVRSRERKANIKYRAKPSTMAKRAKYYAEHSTTAEAKADKAKRNAAYRANPENKLRISKTNAARYKATPRVPTGSARCQADAMVRLYVVASPELGAAKLGNGTDQRAKSHGWDVVFTSGLMRKDAAEQIERATVGYGGIVPGSFLTKDMMKYAGYTETFDIMSLDDVVTHVKNLTERYAAAA